VVLFSIESDAIIGDNDLPDGEFSEILAKYLPGLIDFLEKSPWHTFLNTPPQNEVSS
jgi:hypothetical protein